MLTKIDTAIKYGKQHGGFGIQILYPGLIQPQLKDTGLYTIGRIDHARITSGTLIPMHPHKDDEILTYLRNGKVKHLDSEGFTGIISNQQLMLMNAGASFYHEERVLEGDVLEGLQIFIRPEIAGLQPQVQFYQLPEIYSTNQWRKIAGNGKEYPLQIRSNTWLLDLRLEKGEDVFLPDTPVENCVFLLYVFSGEIHVDENMLLTTGESVMIEKENPLFNAIETSDIVLFLTQTTAVHYDGGMYSGNLQ